ncbi:hypothetical protein Ddye_002130 [Dipteronia dyeriana]|uniref:CCHC-type domain-containing protein n=1 Tax=Dipteronia dyeriana TaxID=168575 RepID=A0AAD9XPR1_9ROSI|nr:hypothetical protein Ddye_002130 [Dipteronia dyeriana]
MYVSKNMTYEELMTIIQTVVKYNVNKCNVDRQSISIVPDTTCRTFIRNDDDVQFMLLGDRVIPQDSDNTTTWVIPEADSYLFGISRSRNLAAEEPTSIIYKGPSLRGFRRCMRLVIAFDGTHLKGRFRGIMFVAIAQDGNEHMYLIVFGYGESENNLSWEWFLDWLKVALGHKDDLTLIDAYSISVIPIGHSSSWVVPNDIVEWVVFNPIFKRQAGCPMAGRHASSSERTTTQLCRSCGQSGHNSRRCSNSHLINEGLSRVILENYTHKCSICHSVGHNKQTCPEKDSTVE